MLEIIPFLRLYGFKRGKDEDPGQQMAIRIRKQEQEPLPADYADFADYLRAEKSPV